MAGSWRPRTSRLERVSRSADRADKRGSLDGRVVQAGPIDMRDRDSGEEGGNDFEFYVQPEPPESAGYGAFWLDTEPTLPV